jgi:hypothetical protein
MHGHNRDVSSQIKVLSDEMSLHFKKTKGYEINENFLYIFLKMVAVRWL